MELDQSLVPPVPGKAKEGNGGGSDSRNAKQTQGKKGNGAQKRKQKKD